MDLTPHPQPWALLLQLNIIDMVSRSTPLGYGVLILLVLLSLMSWAIIFSKWSAFRHARDSNTKFLRAFRKATGLDGIVIPGGFGYRGIEGKVQAARFGREPLPTPLSIF